VLSNFIVIIDRWYSTVFSIIGCLGLNSCQFLLPGGSMNPGNVVQLLLSKKNHKYVHYSTTIKAMGK
jgi:hypothetical protein